MLVADNGRRGAFITLGSHERDDLRVVIAWVLEQREVTDVILYGRSMGSVAALLVASEVSPDRERALKRFACAR